MQRTLLALALLASGLPPSAASAQAVAEAVAAFDEGELERAGELLDAANVTTRAELVRRMTFQMLVAHALGQEEARDRWLFRLGTLIGVDALDGRVPPPLRQRFEQLREGAPPLGLEVSTERRDDSAVVTARVEGDRAGMVERVELAARAAGTAWRVAEGLDVRLDADRATDIEYHARALGPGSIELAALGAPDAPLVSAARPPTGGDGAEPAGDDTVWIVLGVVGAVLVVGAGVTIGVVAATQPGSTRFDGPPVVEW